MALTRLLPITAPTPPRAASREDAQILVAEGDAGQQALVLAHRPAQRKRDLLATVARVKQFRGFKLPLPR
jgi:hypothetical protein